MLSLQSITKLQTAQKLLDDKLCKELNIDSTQWKTLKLNQEIALTVEVAEFINETFDAWKYWKRKPINLERILDECVDVVHFFIQHTIQEGHTAEHITERLTFIVDMTHRELEHVAPTVVRMKALRSQSAYYQMALVLFIASTYGFTEDDIMNQYDVKNIINLRRAKEGY